MSFKKVCKVCGRTFHSAKYSSRFCSENCYVKAKNWAKETRYLLEKEGDNLYSSTLNSGEFDGIGVDISANGGYMETGVLEMSNVDLSSEFTEMITTQRGFQANSRVITTSDTLLEELVNLKR